MHHLPLVLSIIPFITLAQSVTTRMGARSAAMGAAGFGTADESSVFQNIGALAVTEHASAFFTYDLAPSLIGANRTAAAITVPSRIGVFAAGAFHFGDELYREQLLTVGFGHRLGNTSLGLKANMIQYRADGFGTRSAFTVDVGGHTRITPEWTIGAGIFNITQAGIGDGVPLPVILVAAVGWQPTGGPLLLIETEKKLHAPLCIKGGMEVGIRKKIFGRAGFSLQPLTLTAGIGTRSHRLALDFATTFHPVLSFLYQASAGYRLSRPATP